MKAKPCIGTGSFSEVFLVRRKSDNKNYALKKVFLNFSNMFRLTCQNYQTKRKRMHLTRYEYLLPFSNHWSLISCSHENIISYKEAFYEDLTKSLCIVMEYAENGDLLSRIKFYKEKNQFMPEEEVWSILRQLLKGLRALHKRQIIHRDIKCANVFLTKDGKVKLGDLNVSKVAKMGLLQT